MIPDAGLFIAIAEIAGVFVGFGALISVSRRADADPGQLGAVRAVVTAGLSVVVAALVPVALGSYGVEGRPLWLISSIVFLALSWVIIGLGVRSEANRRLLSSLAREQPLSLVFFWLVLELPIQVPLILAIIGLFPEHDAAFYITALAFSLFEAAFVLAQFVYAQRSTPERD